MKRVLLTNNSLVNFAGTECYVLDVAQGLLARGWQPVAFSTQLGTVAEALRKLSIPVVNDLNLLSEPPDLIHAHHHLDAMTAIQAFPGVPTILFCHSWIHWQERPFQHPQICHYVGVDAICRDRLVIETGIPKEKVSLLLNFVDLKKFQQRPPLPEVPKKALIFGNYIAPSSLMYRSIKGACDAFGIQLDGIGHHFGGRVPHPEETLPEYDIVFAKARCAMEALATGCATVNCDAHGLAGMVTPENYSLLRENNFGYRVLKQNESPSIDDVLRELQKYSAQSSEQVSAQFRGTGSKEQALDALESLYHRVLEEHAGQMIDWQAHQQATAQYLLSLSQQTKHLHLLPASLDRANREINALKKQHEQEKLTQQLRIKKLDSQDQIRASRLKDQDAQIQQYRIQLEHLEQDLHLVRQEFESAQSEIKDVRTQNQRLKKEIAKVRKQSTKLEEALSRNRGFKRFLPKWLIRSF